MKYVKISLNFCRENRWKLKPLEFILVCTKTKKFLKINQLDLYSDLTQFMLHVLKFDVHFKPLDYLETKSD